MLRGFYKTDVVTLTQDEPVTKAAALMRDRHIGNVVVVRRLRSDGMRDAFVPVGLITDRDIAIGCVASGSERAMEMSVEEVMSRDPICAKETDGIYEVVQTMRQMGVSRMPVVNELGHLVGIITAKNILALLSDELTEVVEISDAQREAAQMAAPSRKRPRELRLQ